MLIFLNHKTFHWIAAAFIFAFFMNACQQVSTRSVDQIASGKTNISIRDNQWRINSALTYPGTKAEGLLMNLRMVNSTFEDKNRPEFDSDLNTKRFIAAIPQYVEQGARAFTFNLQGGMPGYEGAVNSAFNPDGTLRQAYMQRIKRVIQACDDHGCAVILGCFYQRQDQILKDETAIRNGVINTVKWIKDSGFKNILLEIANEFSHGGFDHSLLKSPEGEVELIKLAKSIDPGLLVSTSGLGDGKSHRSVAEACDYILIHFNGTPVNDIPKRVQTLKKYGKPIVCNEDDKIGQSAADAATASVLNGISWGYMNKEVNQYTPFVFDGVNDDPVMYKTLKQLTSEK